MREIALALAFVTGLAAPAFAQKAEIEAVNAKWMEFFNKGDFAGIASLYTADASAFPPGSPVVRGRDAIGAMWKGMAEKVTDPKVTTLDVKPLGPAAAREIGTFSLKTKGPTPQEVTGSLPPTSGMMASRSANASYAALDPGERSILSVETGPGIGGPRGCLLHAFANGRPFLLHDPQLALRMRPVFFGDALIVGAEERG